MPSTVFDHPIFPGSKIIKKDITVTNTSGAYSETFTDNRISAGMQVNKMYVEDPSVFRSDISVQTLGGSFVFSCSDVVGTTDVTLEFLKIADDPNGITSTEFNILNNKIGEVPEGSNLQDEIDDINGNLANKVTTIGNVKLFLKIFNSSEQGFTNGSTTVDVSQFIDTSKYDCSSHAFATLHTASVVAITSVEKTGDYVYTVRATRLSSNPGDPYSGTTGMRLMFAYFEKS